ncbi:aspartate/glutamate racemase family protein [Streptomyces avicenniae]|uniref:aspartate/glutamate racemase family protein n=1 Tax=Streptomyces avicenniae TaxID=500153 RepID=UPI00069C9DE7|nr:amino acid racemase [Streptomyces avicenniae]
MSEQTTAGAEADALHAGILGHSAEGAAHCFLTFCREGFATVGPHDHPDVTLDLVPLARSMPAWDAGDHLAIRATLAESAARLARAGADFFVCPDNTAHLALGAAGPDLPLPGLHLPDVVAERAAAEGRRRIGVLGTRFTMDGPLYPEAFARWGMAAETPDADDRETIDRIIFTELLNGRFTPAARQAYARVVDRLAARGCDAVALVCTEIPLLVGPGDVCLPVLDSTRLAAQAAFEVATGRRPLPRWRGGPLPGDG